MKKLITLIFSLSIILIAQSQVSKTINVTTAGTLSTLLTATEKSTITNLTVTGNIDARDFKTMRDSLILLADVDISETVLTEYRGNKGTNDTITTLYPAFEIPVYAFGSKSLLYNDKILHSIIIPSTTKSIGDYAFQFCTNLTTINIVSSVTTIGKSAFLSCTSLSSVSIPSSVIKIGESAFLLVYCSINVDTSNPVFSSIDGVLFNKKQSALIKYPINKVGSYNIPNTVDSISSQAFFRCSNLTAVTIPASVKYIGTQAFSYCSGMNSVIVPASVLSMGSYVFMSSNCFIIVDDSNMNFSSAEGILFDKLKTKLIQCPTSKAALYNIPVSVNSIGNMAFRDCNSLTSIKIPSSITNIGTSAFFNCSSLSSLYVLSPNPIVLPSTSNVFYNINNASCTLYVPIGSKAKYQSATLWKDFQNIVEMSTAVPTLSDKKVYLYPNPMTESFQISGVEGTSTVSVSDLNGKTLFSKQVLGNENISVVKLPKGRYIAKIITAEGTIERKIIKE